MGLPSVIKGGTAAAAGEIDLLADMGAGREGMINRNSRLMKLTTEVGLIDQGIIHRSTVVASRTVSGRNEAETHRILNYTYSWLSISERARPCAT
jgi:hypothetical protein